MRSIHKQALTGFCDHVACMHSIKVAHVSEPSVSLGRWLELKGLAYKIRKNAKGGHTPDMQLQSTQQQPQQQRTLHSSSHSKGPQAVAMAVAAVRTHSRMPPQQGKLALAAAS